MNQFRSSRNELELFIWHCNYKLSNRCPHYVMGRLSLLHGVPSRYIHVHVYIYTVYELSLNNGENFFLEPLCSSYISNSFQENCQQHIELTGLSANARCFSFVTHLSCWRLNRAFLIFRCLSLYLSFFNVFFLFSSFSPVPFGQFQLNLPWVKGYSFLFKKGATPFSRGRW